MSDLANRIRAFGGKLENVQSKIIHRMAGAVFLVAACYLFARIPLEKSQENLPNFAHFMVLIPYFLVMILWAWSISGRRGETLMRSFYSEGHVANSLTLGIEFPIVCSISLLYFSATCFASLSSTLSDAGLLQYEPALPKHHLGKVIDFYMWHFAKAIPFINIPEFLLWKQPYAHLNAWSGLPILVFNTLVVVPVIGTFEAWNRFRKEAKRRASG